MFQAIGLGILFIVLSIFMPSVLHALEEFLLALLNVGTAIVSNATPEHLGVLFGQLP